MPWESQVPALRSKRTDVSAGKQVGAAAGPAADNYLPTLEASVVPFKSPSDELRNLNQGRLDAVMESPLSVLRFPLRNSRSKPAMRTHAPRQSLRGAVSTGDRRAFRRPALRSVGSSAPNPVRWND
jgi:ABC-type amino acid transport substrate-binding protein